jgi:hypothetical protein
MTRCLNCRSHVTERYARVQGDNQNQVHECPQCGDDSNVGRRMNGAAAGLDGVDDRKLTTAATHQS